MPGFKHFQMRAVVASPVIQTERWRSMPVAIGRQGGGGAGRERGGKLDGTDMKGFVERLFCRRVSKAGRRPVERRLRRWSSTRKLGTESDLICSVIAGPPSSSMSHLTENGQVN